MAAGRPHTSQQPDLAGLTRHERREGRGDDDPGDDDAHRSDNLEQGERLRSSGVRTRGTHGDDIGGSVGLRTRLRSGQSLGDGTEKFLVTGSRLSGDIEDGGVAGKPHCGLGLAGSEDVGGVASVAPGDIGRWLDHPYDGDGCGGGVLGGLHGESTADLYVLLPLQD